MQPSSLARDVEALYTSHKHYLKEKSKALVQIVEKFCLEQKQEYLEKKSERLFEKFEEKVKRIYAKNGEEAPICPVCRNILLSTTKKRLECNHFVCHQCFFSLLRQCCSKKMISTKCPICRKMSHVRPMFEAFYHSSMSDRIEIGSDISGISNISGYEGAIPEIIDDDLFTTYSGSESESNNSPSTFHRTNINRNFIISESRID